MEERAIVNGSQIAHKIIDNVKRVIIGKPTVIERDLAALVSGGHLLVEDVPERVPVPGIHSSSR